MPHSEEIRFILAKRSLKVMEFVSTSAFEDIRFGRNIVDIIILLGADIGEYENKPMTVAKLAMFIGMPRSTVIRRVKKLVERDILQVNENNQIITTDAVKRRAEKIMPRIKRSSILRNVTFLSKMDAQPIAAKNRE